MALKWKDSFSCNIEEIDNQHKRLFEIGSNLFAIASLSGDFDHYDEVSKIIGELKNYTIYHFGYEEELMLKLNYPKFDEHKAEHQAFIRKVLKFEQEDLDIKQAESVMNLIVFVADWVTAHILKTDIQYKDFFNSNGIY